MKSPNYSRRELMKMMSLTMVGSSVLPFFAKASSNENLDYFDESPKAIHIKKGSGNAGVVGGMDIVFKLTKAQTGGHLGCDEVTMKPGFLGAPPHLHKTFDEICYVLEGTIHIMVGDEVFEVNAGDWHLRPRGIVHTFWNSGPTTSKFIDLYVPGGHEQYMVDLASLFENNNRPKPEEMASLANKFDITFNWDKLGAIVEKYKVHL
ncbi:cupin domain-containing protein [Pedobacter frigiditerrae]|uniref:cupin domain-containing protein n=1 Tax=Pedobacter frigiditerrae TaxID=2530452 RepID=UPI0029309EBA|nr:cupin domain-containing protein [Pedobacter frigiditerrae]